MKDAVLVLQYPDASHERTIALAATRNPKALYVFKDTVLKEAMQSYINTDDEVLMLKEELEYKRLKDLLNFLIPDQEK